MPWTGPRSRWPDWKPSLLQCQKVQNQMNDTGSAPARDGAKDEPERHPIAHLELLPACRQLVGHVRLERILCVERRHRLRAEEWTRSSVGDERHLEHVLSFSGQRVELEAQVEPSVA